MRVLFQAINAAKNFIHFSTYGLSRSFYGALKLRSQQISIRGIASNIHPEFATEIKEYPGESPKLDLCIFESGNNRDVWETAPHSKLIVIDGLLAFKGAANLTETAWRKVAKGLDHVEVVTDIDQIADLHNSLFSRVWAAQSSIGDEIVMDEDIPF